MSNDELSPQLEALLQKQLASGDYATKEDVLLAALQSLDSQSEDWAAVNEALQTLEAGDPGLSLDEAVQEVRRRNNVAS